MRGNLRISVKDASGVTSDGADAWGESDMDMFVKIELKSQTAGVKVSKQLRGERESEREREREGGEERESK